MNFITQDCPQKLALRGEDYTFSYAELINAVQKMELQLKKLPQGILVLYAKPEPLFIVQLLAALNIGKPLALLAHESETQKRALLGTNMSIDEQGLLVALQENTCIKPHPELALILFTSGSTGQVKAVQLSKRNIIANCEAVIHALEFKNIHEQLLFLPLSYSFGLLGQLIPALMTGKKTQLLNQFMEIKSILEKGCVPQMWSGVPSHWVAISRMATLYPESAAQIKALVSAGAPLALSLRINLHRTFPKAIIYNNYGLTEASPRVLTYSNKDPLFFEDYAGYPVGDWQLKLSSEQELLIKGPQLMLGYLGEASRTRMQNQWYATGDLAEILPNGLVSVKGRLDFVVNIGGEKINLIEIEHQIGQLEAIKEVLVLALHDELYGMRLLVCLEKHTFELGISEQELCEQLKLHLLPKKLPLSVRFVDKLPRNHHGKLDRKLLEVSLGKKP